MAANESGSPPTWSRSRESEPVQGTGNMLLLQEQDSIVGFAWVDSHLDLWLIVCNGSAFL